MKKVLYSLAALVFLASCSNNDDATPDTSNQEFKNGILIVNEGGYNKNNASVSFLSNDLSVLKNDIFAGSNNGAGLGDVAQSLAVYNNYAFIVMNNSNSIEIVDRYTFKKVGQITEQLAQPRYLAVANNKIYVTNMAEDKVTVYDATNFAYIKTLTTNFAPELITSNNNYVYVQSNTYGGDKVVEVFSLANDVSVKTLEFTYPSNGLTVDKSSGNIYTLHSDDTGTSVSIINGSSNTIEKEQSSTSLKNARYAVIDNGYLYFTAGTGIYKTQVSLNALPSAPLFNVEDNSFSTLYGFNVLNGKIFTSDAKGFVTNSEVSVYDTNGNFLKKVTAQIGTNGFIQN